MTLLLLTSLAVCSPPGPDVWNAVEHFHKGVELRGNAALARPEFAKSAAAFDRLDSRFPAVALNRARAHRLAGDLPGAILALRQGLAATPADRDLQQALASARADVAFPVGGELEVLCRPRATTSLATVLSPLQATIVGGALWLLACLTATRYLMTRERKWLAMAAISLAVLIGFAGLWWRDHREVDHERGDRFAVLAEDVVLRTGNAASFALRIEAALPRGVEVRIVGERGGWLHVELASGLGGWVPSDAVVE